MMISESVNRQNNQNSICNDDDPKLSLPFRFSNCDISLLRNG